MLNEILFPRCAPALGKVGALGAAFLQLAPCLSLFLLSHFVSGIARLLRGQKERKKGRKVNEDKNSAESTQKKVISTRRYSRPFCRDLQGDVWDGFRFSCSLKRLSKQN